MPKIREEFKDHIATILLDTKDVKVMNWQEPGTSNYQINFTINKNYLFITGDLGCAIFELTWYPTFYSEWTESRHYLLEKLRAWSEEQNTWSVDKARQDLEEWRTEEMKSDYIDKDEIETVYETISDCLDDTESGLGNKWEFAHLVNNTKIVDPWEIFDDLGKEVPGRFIIWFDALYMASIQLETRKEIE